MFSLNETTLLSAISSGSILSVVNSVLSPGYGIYLKSGAAAISPTSFVGVEYGADATVLSAPIESGSYSSYNKIKRPALIRATFTLEGWTGLSGAIPNLTNFSLTSRSDLLGELDAMVASASLYDIETPDTTYQDYDLVRYNYRTSSREVTLLTVEAIFQAVMQEAEVTITNANAQNGKGKPSRGEGPPQNVPSSTQPSTIDDVKGALTGLKDSLTSAATTVATSVKSAVGAATSTATSAINGAATSSIKTLSTAVDELVKGLS